MAAQTILPPEAELASTGRAKVQHSKEFQAAPLAVMLCAQVIETEEASRYLEDIACLRVYLLVTAMQDRTPGPRTQEAAKHVVRFLEEATRYPKALRWIAQISGANRHFDTYLTGISDGAKTLKAEIRSNQSTNDSSHAGIRFARDMEATAKGCASRSEETTERQKASFTNNDWSSALEEHFGGNSEIQVEKIGALPSEDDHEEDPTEIAILTKSPTPEHRYRLGLGLHLQTQTERNVLAYSWDRLRPDELEILLRLIDHWLQTKSLRLLGAISSLALLTRNSIEVACSTVLSASPEDSPWVLNVEVGKLIRRPNRPLQRFRILERAEAWVRPLAAINEVQLSPRIHAILLDALKEKPSANTLGGFWTEETSPHAKFDQICRETPGLQRIKQGMLKATADQLIFNETNDSTFTRMLLTPAQSVTPSAGSYSSWTQAYANSAFSRLSHDVLPPSNLPQGENALGSEIDPDDSKIQEAFASASARIDSIFDAHQPDTWVDLHNAITVYSVVTLLACTGARPVTSIFECLQDFDLNQSRARIFIDDKVIHEARSGRWGRITPLPPLATELMQKLYLPYFDWLLDHLTALGVGNPDYAALAFGMQEHKAEGKRPNMPLFFLLKQAPKLRIVEINETEIAESGCFDWPLPCNLFRHRLSTRLRSNGAGEDFAAAQLGHAEAGSEVYGSFSPQCWADDENRWRQALEEATRPLGISIVQFRTPATTPLSVSSNFQSFLGKTRFGSEARRYDRASNQQHAEAAALAMIQQRIASALNEAGVEALAVDQSSFPEKLDEDQLRRLNDQDFWTGLGRQMLFTDADTPRPNHAIWFQTFEDFRAKVFAGSYAPKLDRLLVNRPKTQRFAFPHATLLAEGNLAILRQHIRQVFDTVPIYRRSLKLQGALSAIDMALTGLVSDASLLKRLGNCDPAGFQTHVRASILYLARIPSRDEQASPAFGWQCVPARCANDVLNIISSTGKTQQSTTIPKELATFARYTESTLQHPNESLQNTDQLIDKICELVNHHNRLALPGIVAAVRCGETASWSLDAYGLARAAFSKHVDELKVIPGLTLKLNIPDARIPSIGDSLGSRDADEALLKVVRTHVTEFETKASKIKAIKTEASKTEAHKKKVNKINWSDRKRLRAATKIERELHQSRDSVSSSVQLLVSWVLQMLRANGVAGKMLRSSSILTYISLLAPAFLDHGREINLIEADEDDLEEFYFKVLTRPVDEARRRHAHDGDDRRLDERAVLGRLRTFHDFIEQVYGAESPDWSVLGEDLTSSQVSAYIITTQEYQSALEILCPAGSGFDHDAYLEAFLLILGFRFGLRSGEAISMARHNWVSVEGGCVVLVSGIHKRLKSTAARRQVPLLGQLTSHEAAVVAGWLDHWVTLDLPPAAPLFPSGITPKVPVRLQDHRFRVATALRTATKCDRVTFHHARHSFASAMFLRLMAPHLLPTLPGMGASWLWQAGEVQKQLLGRIGVTRRSPWALSVMLGHSHPRTTLVSYCHFAHEWGNARLTEKHPTDFVLRKIEHLPSWVNNLSLMAADADPTSPFPCLVRLKRTSRTPQDVLHFLEKLSRGMLPSRAGWLCSFDQSETSSLMTLLGHLTHNPAKIPVLHDHPVREDSRLGQIIKGPSPRRWEELRGLVGNRELPPLDGRDGVYQVAGPLQILLWRDQHFDALQVVMNAFGWRKADLEIYYPPSGAHTSSALSEEFGWSPVTTNSKSGGRKIHVDVARYPTPLMRRQTSSGYIHLSETKDRVGVTLKLSRAAAPRPQPSGLSERADLVRIWLAIHLRAN
ncbi:tyrosine-type recombinase/integrase [Polaromonas sp. AET17H-212]|uniref:tyrosine-type recombinase/integrase n=1 Tax=Polaromonas sp. AET17H-212 TaxID=1977061 RepID=UPI001C3EAB6C|nr:tyrosine-type recombinase/integrase [Polaromonas sp. AET17H-212]